MTQKVRLLEWTLFFNPKACCDACLPELKMLTSRRTQRCTSFSPTTLCRLLSAVRPSFVVPEGLQGLVYDWRLETLGARFAHAVGVRGVPWPLTCQVDLCPVLWPSGVGWWLLELFPQLSPPLPPPCQLPSGSSKSPAREGKVGRPQPPGSDDPYLSRCVTSRTLPLIVCFLQQMLYYC